MKRHLPRVLSSFRSSKRRIPIQQQQVVVQENEEPIEYARSSETEFLLSHEPFQSKHHEEDIPLSEDDDHQQSHLPIKPTLIRINSFKQQENDNNNSQGTFSPFSFFNNDKNLYSSKRWKTLPAKCNKSTDCRAFDMVGFLEEEKTFEQNMCKNIGEIIFGLEISQENIIRKWKNAN